jgi:hypothetical protein
MADDFAKSLQSNPLFKAVGKLANMDNYRIGGKKAAPAKPGQPSNLKASDYASQKPYMAPGSNWGDGQKASGKKAPMKKPKPKPEMPMKKGMKPKAAGKMQKPGFPAKKKGKKNK